MNRLALLAICSSTIAHADSDTIPSPGRDPIGEPNGYVAGSATVGKDRFQYEAFTVEAGSRLQRWPLFGRLLGSAGNTRSDNFPGTGTFVEGRVGLEGRSCTHQGMICGSLGLDVGMHRGRFDRIPVDATVNKPEGTPAPIDDGSEFDTVVMVPRLTIDGGARVRMRGVLELPSQVRAEHGSETGYAISIGIGVGF